METVELVKKYIIDESEKYKKISEDHYDFWDEHIKYVFDEGIKLAEAYGADVEIVSLGALLHDVALIERVGDRKDHHINGEKIAKEVLERLNYDDFKKERVLKCVYNHRSSKNAKTIEEICVADADILAHFDNIPMLFNLAFVKNNISLNEINDFVEAAFEKDFDDLSERTKKGFAERYELIKEIVIRKSGIIVI